MLHLAFAIPLVVLFAATLGFGVVAGAISGVAVILSRILAVFVHFSLAATHFGHRRFHAP